MDAPPPQQLATQRCPLPPAQLPRGRTRPLALFVAAQAGAAHTRFMHLTITQIEATVAKEEGNKAFAAKKYEEAVTHFSRAVELDPRCARPPHSVLLCAPGSVRSSRQQAAAVHGPGRTACGQRLRYHAPLAALPCRAPVGPRSPQIIPDTTST